MVPIRKNYMSLIKIYSKVPLDIAAFQKTIVHIRYHANLQCKLEGKQQTIYSLAFWLCSCISITPTRAAFSPLQVTSWSTLLLQALLSYSLQSVWSSFSSSQFLIVPNFLLTLTVPVRYFHLFHSEFSHSYSGLFFFSLSSFIFLHMLYKLVSDFFLAFWEISYIS